VDDRKGLSSVKKFLKMARCQGCLGGLELSKGGNKREAPFEERGVFYFFDGIKKKVSAWKYRQFLKRGGEKRRTSTKVTSRVLRKEIEKKCR